MFDYFKSCVLSQFEAALWMLNDCIAKCPDQHWSGPNSIIGKYEFWLVAYHTLYCTDLYLSRNDQSLEYPPQFYPGGKSDMDDEYPSRMMTRHELLDFAAFCLAKLRSAMASETAESIVAHCGFSHKKLTRGELYIYNMRHIMHHTGQLSALIRRTSVDETRQPKWGNAGWPR